MPGEAFLRQNAAQRIERKYHTGENLIAILSRVVSAAYDSDAALLDRLELLLQDTDFIRNLLYRLIACFNLYGVKCLIHMDSCHAYSPSNIAFAFLRFC